MFVKGDEKIPYKSEHSARIKDPEQFKKFRRENNKMGNGVDVIWGITDSGKTEIQALRFDKKKFSPEESQRWCKEHDLHPIEFHPATVNAEEDFDDTMLLEQALSHTLKGVEIFRTGTWKGRTFNEQDLDEMVTNWNEFKNTWFQPAVKDGHHFEPGKPALGYLDNVRRVGQKLVADLIELPVKVFEMIRDKRYDRVSAEIAPNIEKNGKKYKWVLSALAILGPEIPEVTGLKPLRECFSEGQEIEQYDLEDGLIQLAEWTSAYVSDLPDAAFAVIQSGGEKDTEGKTKPRSLRKLPHHNANVKSGTDNDTVDLPHLRNALARLPQANISPEQKKGALSHLEAHAKALNVGEQYDWGSLYEQFATPVMDTCSPSGQCDCCKDGVCNCKNEKCNCENKKPLQMGQNMKGEKKMSDEKVAELQALIEQFESKISEYEDKIEKYEADLKGKSTDAEPDKIKVLVNQLSETQTRLLNAMETVKNSEKKIMDLEEHGRKNRIQAKLDTLRVPAFKFYAEQFYDWATREGEEVVTYSRDGIKKEVLKEQIVDEFVGLINKATDNLFIQHSKVDVFKRDDVPGDEDPSKEVDRRVKTYQEQHPTVDYATAMKAIFDADPVLKSAYAGR